MKIRWHLESLICMFFIRFQELMKYLLTLTMMTELLISSRFSLVYM